MKLKNRSLHKCNWWSDLFFPQAYWLPACKPFTLAGAPPPPTPPHQENVQSFQRSSCCVLLLDVFGFPPFQHESSFTSQNMPSALQRLWISLECRFFFFFFNRVTIYRAFLMSYKTKRTRAAHTKRNKSTDQNSLLQAVFGIV